MNKQSNCNNDFEQRSFTGLKTSKVKKIIQNKRNDRRDQQSRSKFDSTVLNDSSLHMTQPMTQPSTHEKGKRRSVYSRPQGLSVGCGSKIGQTKT
jgi:hypothetical protein